MLQCMYTVSGTEKTHERLQLCCKKLKVILYCNNLPSNQVAKRHDTEAVQSL